MEIKNKGLRIEAYLTELEPGQLGYDLRLLDEAASLGEYILALDLFQAEYMADCRGCDGCCYERIPLTAADFCLAEKLREQEGLGEGLGEGLAAWLQYAAEARVLSSGGIDITLRRKPDFACCFLDTERQECKEHSSRPLVCRTHCCLPKSELAQAIRAEIVNAGEDELVRLLLAAGGEPWPQLLQGQKADDYPQSGFSEGGWREWQSIPLKTLISAENRQLLLEQSKTL